MIDEWDLDEHRESTANRHTDRIGFCEIGGIGQLIYHNFRFADYDFDDDRDNDVLARPICDKDHPPDMNPKDNLDGREILTSLCNLAQRIDDFEEPTPYQVLILDWCKENMHPYNIDSLYDELTDEKFDIGSYDAYMAERDGIFSVTEFMKDLEKLYNAARFYIALDDMFMCNDDTAYDMYQEGKHFEALPYFEKYKRSHDFPEIDVSAAGGDLLKEMKIERKYMKAHPLPEPPEGEFAELPYDDYDDLRQRLVECIPDFRLRLKLDPNTQRYVFSADVNSVFDIAWCVLAKLMSEQPEPLFIGREIKDSRPEGIMICCIHCGKFFIRNAKHQQYCNNLECQKARNAKNQKEFRVRKRREKALKTKKSPAKSE